MKSHRTRPVIGRTKRRLIVDTNLLLLAVVGASDTSLIKRFERTRKYTVADFDAVVSAMSRFTELVITPGIAVETSNWIRYLDGAACESVWNHFCNMIGRAGEIPVASATACQHPDSPRLGITDCSILIAAGKKHVVLTDDGPFSSALHAQGIEVLHLEQLR